MLTRNVKRADLIGIIFRQFLFQARRLERAVVTGPASTANNAADIGLRDSEPVGERPLANVSERVKFANLFDFNIRKLTLRCEVVAQRQFMTSQYPQQVSAAYVIARGKVSNRNACAMRFEDLSQSRDVVVDRATDATATMTPFFNAIAHVVCLRSKEQMRRIHTPWHIAFMAKEHAGRNVAVCE